MRIPLSFLLPATAPQLQRSLRIAIQIYHMTASSRASRAVAPTNSALTHPSFHSLIPVIQILVNIAFDSDLYRCGCQCTKYTSTAGDVFLLSEASAPGSEKHSPLHRVLNLSLNSSLTLRFGSALSPPQNAAPGAQPPLWPRALRSKADPARVFAVPSAELTCVARDPTKCGVRFSDPVSVVRGVFNAAPRHDARGWRQRA